ncbi:MAG: glycosyltransferase family 4 protein [Rubrobacter sp.]|nr:glycosyltransferase family 4 protein [Rubrobacter sp.]
MRILQVCQPAEGGVAHYALVLSTELNGRGWPVDVACSPGALADELRSRGIGVLPLPLVRGFSPQKDLIATLELWKMIRKRRYSLVHTHSAKAGVVGRIAARMAQTPAVHTPNAWSFLVSDSTFERWVYVAVERVLALLSSRIICVSTRELELGRRWLVGVDEKLRLVPNGITLPPQTRVRSEVGELVVGTVARLARQKGIEHLIQAAEGVCAKRKGVRFSVAGGGPDFERLNTAIQRRGLRHRFELIGPVQAPWGYLEQIDIFVLPSLWEGMPFALLEAMSFGLPVVATDVGGVRDVIPDETFGIVVPPADPHALQEAILRYVDSPQLRNTAGATARERVVQEFSRERMVERTLSIYSEVLKC